MILKKDIQIRDPYVYVEGGRYYLYGTTSADCWRGEASDFEAYAGNDLEHFESVGKIFVAQEGFWGTQNYWAPEMHPYKGAYYLFASFKTPGKRRATSILRAEKPEGPFLPWGAEAVTPPEWECLDGTLFVDDEDNPWIVFCHEWVQEGGGTICARRLKEDLSAPEQDTITLFSAADAPWTKLIRHSSGIEGYVTDGPFLHRAETGELIMLWSSLTDSGYAIGQAVSESGNVLGPWKQVEKPIFSGDGGHGMIFRDLEGSLRLAIHSPNKTPNERPVFLPVRENGNIIELA